MIVFHVARLEKEPEELEGTEPAALLELSAEDGITAETPVEYALHGELVRGGVLVTGRVGTTISGCCGRCLEPVRRKVEARDLELFFEITPRQDELDVTEDIRAELLLAFPMNLLCSEECRGLCPVCGRNRNLEECSCKIAGAQSDRWSALDDLKI